VPIPLLALDVQRAGEPGHPGANGSDCAASRVTSWTGFESVIMRDITDQSVQNTIRHREGAGYLIFSIAFIVEYTTAVRGKVRAIGKLEDFAGSAVIGRISAHKPSGPSRQAGNGAFRLKSDASMRNGLDTRETLFGSNQ
jgi:hypothetical protein